jgi:hypothetical protein
MLPWDLDLAYYLGVINEQKGGDPLSRELCGGTRQFGTTAMGEPSAS